MKPIKTIKLLLLVVLFSSVSINAIRLTAPILKRIDGIFINGERVKEMLWVRKELVNRLDGHKTRNAAVRLGHYNFEDRTYTLKELVVLEKEIIKEANPDRLKTFKELFETVLEEFIKISNPFMEPISKMKALVLPLIKESCEKRERLDSYLLQWGEVKKGDEIKMIREQITTFAQIELFCDDLVNYLQDILNSSPKAVAQFKHEYLGKK